MFVWDEDKEQAHGLDAGLGTIARSSVCSPRSFSRDLSANCGPSRTQIEAWVASPSHDGEASARRSDSEDDLSDHRAAQLLDPGDREYRYEKSDLGDCSRGGAQVQSPGFFVGGRRSHCFEDP